jgi:hypothetical protein
MDRRDTVAEMSETHLQEPDEQFRERLLRVARIALLLSLLPWIATFFRSRETMRTFMELGTGVLAAISAVRYYRRRIVVHAPTGFIESRSRLVRGIANFVFGYGEILVGFYAFVAILGLFDIVDYFIK